MGGYSDLERTDFYHLLLCKSVSSRDLNFNTFYFGRCGGLE